MVWKKNHLKALELFSDCVFKMDGLDLEKDDLSFSALSFCVVIIL
tara:strand:+ start:272 stop:406 length:135 start_codon:yes stop_codon:yes gene_type:complete